MKLARTFIWYVLRGWTGDTFLRITAPLRPFVKTTPPTFFLNVAYDGGEYYLCHMSLLVWGALGLLSVSPDAPCSRRSLRARVLLGCVALMVGGRQMGNMPR